MDPNSYNTSAQAAGGGAYPRYRYSPPPGPPIPQYPPSPTHSPAQHSTEMSLSQSPQSTSSQTPLNQQNQQANWNQRRPPLWQLGSHAQYGYHNSQLHNPSNEASEPIQTTYGWSKNQSDDRNSVERVRVVNYAERPEPEDVELTLHRGLQARQVRTHQPLYA